MAVRTPIGLERAPFVLGLWIGAVLLALSWLVLGSVSLPHALLALGLPPIVTVLALPIGALIVFVYAAVAAAVQRRDPTHWVSMAVGTVVGAVGLMVIALGSIFAIGWLLA